MEESLSEVMRNYHRSYRWADPSDTKCEEAYMWLRSEISTVLEMERKRLLCEQQGDLVGQARNQADASRHASHEATQDTRGSASSRPPNDAPDNGLEHWKGFTKINCWSDLLSDSDEAGHRDEPQRQMSRDRAPEPPEPRDTAMERPPTNGQGRQLRTRGNQAPTRPTRAPQVQDATKRIRTTTPVGYGRQRVGAGTEPIASSSMCHAEACPPKLTIATPIC